VVDGVGARRCGLGEGVGVGDGESLCCPAAGLFPARPVGVGGLTHR